MTIDMDMPFAEFAEKHLKMHKGNNPVSTPGCNAAPISVADVTKAITKPIAEAAEEIVKDIKDAVK